MNDHHPNHNSDDAGPIGPIGVPPGGPAGGADGGPGGHELDGLLRDWHALNAARAAAGREKLLTRLRSQAPVSATSEAKPTPATAPRLALPPLIDDEMAESLRERREQEPRPTLVFTMRRIIMNRYSPAAAAVLLLAVMLPFLFMKTPRYGGVPISSGIESSVKRASFDGYLMAPQGGRLDAVDADGAVLGPCELQHTDVVADVSGFLTRVTLTQKYHNPHRDKIEAVYTFPLSERSAVDRMSMTIGARVIEGQIKERAEARQIYEQAKAAGRIASLLEQERPNIFTQSIANIEPGADITITLSYVELTQQVGGVFAFDFPTTIEPRFIPDAPLTSADRGQTKLPPLPDGRRPRSGLVLIAPGGVTNLQPGDLSNRPQLTQPQALAMLRGAMPIQPISPSSSVWYNFQVAYGDQSVEMGTLYTDGTGVLNARWFFVPPSLMPGAEKPEDAKPSGEGFAGNTPRVPDASRITPMPTRPPNRAGHDISITVNIDSGGPILGEVKSELHPVTTMLNGSRATIHLKNEGEIPNRDFVLKWRQQSTQVEPSVFTHVDDRGNFFAVQLTPPPVDGDNDATPIATPRDMMFVLDVSGSMSGAKIEKAKQLLDKVMGTMRPTDSFNVIKFSNALQKLWPESRQASPQNIVDARAFYSRDPGQGGTQMVAAISEALRSPAAPVFRQLSSVDGWLSIDDLANLPAAGSTQRVRAPFTALRYNEAVEREGKRSGWTLAASNGIIVELDADARGANSPFILTPKGESSFVELVGRWLTRDGQRVFHVSSVRFAPQQSQTPLFERANSSESAVQSRRVVVFITDGEIGNENEVLALIKEHRDHASVFSFGIGNSPNRYLLESMGRFGRGEVEYVNLQSSSDEVIERFSRRLRTPVLTNIRVQFSPELQPVDVLTALGISGSGAADLDAIPDLYDVKPLTIVGRYNTPGAGTVTITGMTASGPYSRSIHLALPAPIAPEARHAAAEGRQARSNSGAPAGATDSPASHDTIATIWARSKVEQIMGEDLRGALAGNFRPDLRQQVVSLGESFGLVTQFTSFVAVDRLRVTIGGAPRLVHIPIELPEGSEYTGFFGGESRPRDTQWWAEMDFEESRSGAWSSYSATPQIDLQLMLQPAEQLARSLTVDLKVDSGTTGQKDAITERALQEMLAQSQSGGAPARAPAPADPPTPSVAPGAPTGGADRPAAPSPTRRIPPSEKRQNDPTPASDPNRPSPGGATEGKPTRDAGAPSDGQRSETGAYKTYHAAESQKESENKLKKEEAPPPRPLDSHKPASAPQQAPGGAPPPAPMPRPAKPATSETRAKPTLPTDQRGDSLSPNNQADNYGANLASGVAKSRKREPQVDGRGGVDQSAAFRWSLSKNAPSFGAAALDDEVRGKLDSLLSLYRSTFETADVSTRSDEPGPKADQSAKDQAGTSHDAKDSNAQTPVSTPPAVIVTQHFSIRIADLVRAQRVDQARTLAVAFHDVFTADAAATQLSTTLADAALPAPDRDRVIAEVGAKAQAELDAMVRASQLKRRLQPELLALTEKPGLPSVLGALADKAPAFDGPTVDGGVMVSIVTNGVDQKMVAAITALGARVEATDASARMVIAVVPLGKIADLALTPGVRRVELTKIEEPASW